MNKKGITPIIAVVLLLMMTVAAAGAAFYWLTRMQQQAQSGVSGAQQQLIEESSASMAVISQAYTDTVDSEALAVDIQNTGGRTISIAAEDIIGVLEDGDGNTVCSSGLLNGSLFNCTSGCTSTLSPGSVEQLDIDISGCVDASGSNLNSGVAYYYQLKFQKGATVSGSFTG